MALAIFDLDNTLLAGDSDYEWGQFLVAQGIVDGEFYARENQRFYADYQAGTLDIYAFLRFSLQPLAENTPGDLRAWRSEFVRTVVAPMILPAARGLLQEHRAAGDTLLIITATNRFVTAPIAERLGVENLIATEAEVHDGRYTGHTTGIPCFQEGKVQRLQQWLKQTGHDLTGSWFYSDSHNDLPLLRLVTHPVAVDPDEMLRRHATQRDWPVITLRGPAAASSLPPSPHR